MTDEMYRSFFREYQNGPNLCLPGQEYTAYEYSPEKADAYEAALRAEKDGLITVAGFEDLPEKTRQRIGKTVPEEYRKADGHPEYRHFLKGCLPNLPNGNPI